ncbi:MAG: alpha/beta hydrolase [Amphritea sp.]
MGIIEPLLKPTPTGGQVCPTRDDLWRALGNGPFLAHRETFHVGSLPVHCEIYEHSLEAPVLLFLPGIGTYAELFAEMLCRISEHGFNVIAIDLPGHGYSGGERGMYTVDSVVESVSLVIDALEQRYSGPFGIYGYSIGALLAVAAAEQDDRIDAVLCGTLLTTEVAPDMFHYLGWQWTWGSALVFPHVKLPLSWIVDYDQLLAGHPAGELINQDPMLVLDYPFKTLASLFGHKAGIMLRDYPFKMAIVQGDEDEVLSLDYSKQVIKQAKQPIELIAIPGEGHMVPLTAPPKLAGIIANWFDLALGR